MFLGSGSTIKNVVGVDATISDEMQNGIELWNDMFRDNAPWIDNNTQSMGVASAISGEIARLTLVEFKSEVSGSTRADFLQGSYKYVIDNLREQIEFATAKGGIVFKPYVDNGKIAIDFVQADKFIPTAYNSRKEIRGAVFIERTKKGKSWYTRLEHHNLTETGYIIQNKAFYSINETTLGTPVSLQSVDEWSNLEPEVTLGYKDGTTLERPLFVYFKMPIANHIDEESPLGVSAYSRAVGLIEQADKQYSRILWEYEGTELAIDASINALNNTRLPERKKRLFRQLELDRGTGGDLYEVFSPEIRDSSLFNGLNQILRRIEFACHLSYGTLSDPQYEAKTAEEIRLSKQRSFAMICNVQSSLECALKDLLWIIDYYTSLYKLAPVGEYEISFNWGDGILSDSNTEFSQLKSMVDSGVLKPEKLISWYFGISEEEAVNYIPQNNTDAGISFFNEE